MNLRVVSDFKFKPAPERLHQTSPPRSGLADRIAAEKRVHCTSLSLPTVYWRLHSCTANSLLATALVYCQQFTGDYTRVLPTVYWRLHSCTVYKIITRVTQETTT